MFNFLLLQLPPNFSEWKALYHIRFGSYAVQPVKKNLDVLAHEMADMEFCYAALEKVSRSFAVVIRQLPHELRNPVCLFYLTLRGLDTIEDDMRLPAVQKTELLLNFHRECSNEKLSLHHIGDQPEYRHLLQHYYKVARAFNLLDKKYQQVIRHICQKMGEGMAEFSERKVETLDDYNRYCHYVAGLVGQGLSGLFAASGHEDARLKNQLFISNEMGLLLQKTNIIRDYHEDLLQGRIFLPEEIWSEYGTTFDSFSNNPTHSKSLDCWVALVNDALQHIPHCLDYLRLLRNEQVFRFCAIPQMMAFATLAEVYNNTEVFCSNVKIRKSLAAKYIVETQDMTHVTDALEAAMKKIESKLQPSLSNTEQTRIIISQIRAALYEPQQYRWENPEFVSPLQTV